MSESQPMSEGASANSLLQESEQRYKAFIENASDMIQSCRPDGSFEFVNRSWLEKMGYTEEEVEKLVVWDIIAPESVDHCVDLFTRAVNGESIDNVRATFVAKDGRKIPLEGDATSRIVDGKVIATHSFFRDITERLRAEDLEKKNLQLEGEKMARYLEKMAALGKLSAGLAHELNNPAAAAQRAGAQLAESAGRRDAALGELHGLALSAETWTALNAFKAGLVRPASGSRRPVEVSRAEEAIEEWLEDHGITDAWYLPPALAGEGIEARKLDELAAVLPEAALKPVLIWLAESSSTAELTDVVTRSTQRISELVAAVKAYSFMDQAAEQVVDVHDGIEQTLTILGHQLRGITIQRQYAEGLPKVRALGSGLNQVWTNIIDNAADAVGSDGVITIRTGAEGDNVIVEIEDNGSGIPAEHVTRVFEPFFSTKPQGEGTGLGLDMVWRIVTEEHHGTVEVASEPGRTIFTVNLPRSS